MNKEQFLNAIQERKRVIIPIGIAVAILTTVLFAVVACSAQSETSVGTNKQAEEVTTQGREENTREGETRTDQSSPAEMTGTGIEGSSQSSDNSAVGAGGDSASTTVGADATAGSIQNDYPSGNSTPLNGNGEVPSAGSPEPSVPSNPVPERHWVNDSETVWIEDSGAWTEEVPRYSTVERSICNICGADITGNTSAHAKQHMLAGEGSGHHSETSRVITGYDYVEHPATGHWETRVVGGHWE